MMFRFYCWLAHGVMAVEHLVAFLTYGYARIPANKRSLGLRVLGFAHLRFGRPE